MADQIFIQHRFTVEQDGVSLTDAIVLPQEEYNKLTTDDIEKQKTQRFDDFKYRIEHPPIEPVLTKEEELSLLDAERVELEKKDSEVQGKEIILSEVDASLIVTKGGI